MAAFPQINAQAVITQLPYTERTLFRTSVNDMESGPRFTRAWRTSPVVGNPATLGQAPRSFKVNYPVISRAEVTVLENFFISMRGRFGEFSFTDNNSVVRTHCRFNTDEIVVSYPEPGRHSLELEIAEYVVP